MCLTHSASVTEEQRLTDQTLAPIAKYLGNLNDSESEKGKISHDGHMIVLHAVTWSHDHCVLIT